MIIPKSKNNLVDIIISHISTYGVNCDLNHIDVSKISDLSYVFNKINFKGDISKWDVSNVTNMHQMFYESEFNGDISNWDVSSVRDMSFMFYRSKFNGDISKWYTGNVLEMSGMFANSLFSGDISEWNVSKVENMVRIFSNNDFNFNISKWNIQDDCLLDGAFYNSSNNTYIHVSPLGFASYLTLNDELLTPSLKDSDKFIEYANIASGLGLEGIQAGKFIYEQMYSQKLENIVAYEFN